MSEHNVSCKNMNIAETHRRDFERLANKRTAHAPQENTLLASHLSCARIVVTHVRIAHAWLWCSSGTHPLAQTVVSLGCSLAVV